MNFSFVHEFDIDPQAYWELFLSDAFNEDLFRELKVKSRTVVEQTDDSKTFHRVQKVEPSTPIPGFLQSLIKDTAYTEIDTLDRSRGVMRIVIETAMFKDRFDMKGDYIVTPLDGGKRCRREFKGEVRVSVPLLGGKIEKYMMEQMRDSYEIATRVTREWIAKKKATS